MPTTELLTIKIFLSNSIDPMNICGVHDSNLRLLERTLGGKITPNADGSLQIKGDSDEVLKIKQVLTKMQQVAHHMISHQDIAIFCANLDDTNQETTKNLLQDVQISKHNKVKPYTKSQLDYIQKIQLHDVTFGVGPAGTGKTYIAVAMALRELQMGNVKKLILTRPVVETDEHLGFLPGTLEDKIDPYVRPLYDAIHNMLPMQEYEKLVQNGQIELAPLAYMRGRTLSNCFVILDEAQNSTVNQMQMFLTRLGQNSKMVITGDMSQIDLHKTQSGLVDAIHKLQSIPEIGFYEFQPNDTVRHGLVKKIIDAYEKN